MKTPITIQTTVSAPLQKVWDYWNEPEHIIQWAFASDDWHAPSAENDLRVGGNFKTVMAAKDGSAKFDFAGTYTQVQDKAVVEYDMSDTRHVKVTFAQVGDAVLVTETFDPEDQNPEEMQRQGWQAILNNFKKLVESSS